MDWAFLDLAAADLPKTGVAELAGVSDGKILWRPPVEHPAADLRRETMALPADFDDALWLRPHVFQGLVGVSLARNFYEKLFRQDGFAKPRADLIKDRRIAKAIAELERPA